MVNIMNPESVEHRQSCIGNPKHEFLPKNKEQISAELRGMIERWKVAGMRLDADVRQRRQQREGMGTPFSLFPPVQ